jgi:hypothetical protein
MSPIDVIPTGRAPDTVTPFPPAVPRAAIDDLGSSSSSQWTDTDTDTGARTACCGEWITHTLPVSHNIMADAPGELTDILLGAAKSISD